MMPNNGKHTKRREVSQTLVPLSQEWLARELSNYKRYKSGSKVIVARVTKECVRNIGEGKALQLIFIRNLCYLREQRLQTLHK